MIKFYFTIYFIFSGSSDKKTHLLVGGTKHDK